MKKKAEKERMRLSKRGKGEGEGAAEGGLIGPGPAVLHLDRPSSSR
jgi:hypothetical protein